MKWKIIIAVSLSMLCGTAWAQDSKESVLLVNVSYSQGRWQAKPGQLLPCAGPSKPDSMSASRSLVQLKNKQGKVLYTRYIENPRIILVEDPKEPVGLLKETRFTLRIPVRGFALRDINTFEFFENGRDPGKPSVTLSLARDIPAMTKRMAADKKPSCRVLRPELEKLPPLTPGQSNAVSPETLTGMIKKDRALLIQWGLENRIKPADLKKIVYKNEQQWRELNLDKAEVDGLLKEYNSAFKKQGR